MKSCRSIRKHVIGFATVPPGQLPPWLRDHLGACPACSRALEGARLSRRLVAATAEAVEPPAGFPTRVVAVLPARPPGGRAEVDLWRPAWGLVPAFAATAAALLLLFRAAPTPAPAPAGLVPAAGLSAGERLVLEARSPDPDRVLAAVMEGPAR